MDLTKGYARHESETLIETIKSRRSVITAKSTPDDVLRQEGIDEAQDMDEHEFALVQALMHAYDDMRVIAVGDDDQSIYQFRGSSPKHMRTLIEYYGALPMKCRKTTGANSALLSLAMLLQCHSKIE